MAAGRRERSKERTREALLEAAAEVFAERGYDGASVEEIAGTADISVGSIYSRFGSKQGLFTALMDRFRAADLDLAVPALDRGGRAGALAAMNEGLVDEADSRRRALLDAESWVHAMRHPELHAALAEHDRATRRVAADLVAAERGDAVLALTDDEIASAVLALYRGLIRQRRLDPGSAPSDLFGRVVGMLLAGMERGAETGEHGVSIEVGE